MTLNKISDDNDLKLPVDFVEMTYDESMADGGLSDWAIAGIVVGGGVAACALGSIASKLICGSWLPWSVVTSSTAVKVATEEVTVSAPRLVKMTPFGLPGPKTPFGLGNWVVMRFPGYRCRGRVATQCRIASERSRRGPPHRLGLPADAGGRRGGDHVHRRLRR